jgi:23S rRNA (adenine2503-C2)-methyltransferase
MSKTTDIRDLDVLQITEALKAMGEPSFRAKQIYQWLWQKGARSFEEMTNLSKPLREKLAEAFTFHVAKIHTAQHSKDGTIKVAFELHDGNKIEGVLIPTSSRTTACVSSQVGCSLDCKFCATGYLKRMRNLSAAEIFDQVWMINELAEEHHGKRLDNIVYMGMGEPLLNLSLIHI